MNSLKWTKLSISKFENEVEIDPGYKIELPRDTLLLAEKVIEYRGEHTGQLNLKAIHIIDAFFINGVNMIISNEKTISLMERSASLQKFEMSINKTTMKHLNLIRVKDFIRMEHISTVFDK